MKFITSSWRKHKRITYLINFCKSDKDLALIYKPKIINFFEIMTEYEHFHSEIPQVQ